MMERRLELIFEKSIESIFCIGTKGTGSLIKRSIVHHTCILINEILFNNPY